LGVSGGLDSRLFLASLHTQALDYRSFTFCLHPQEADHRMARSAAEFLGAPHRTIILDTAVAATHRDYRLINEGESPGFGYLLLAAHAQQETNTLLIGYPGDVYAGAPVGPFQPLSLKSKDQLAHHMLLAHMKLFTADQARRLFASPYRVSWRDVLDEWYDSFGQIQQQSIMDVYLDHMTDYRLQRRTRPRIDAVRWFCQPIYPYMDERLYTTYRSLPLSHLNAERAHLALLCDYRTGLENLPSVARGFAGVPIYKEYRYRSIIHAGRIVRQKIVLPLRRKWQETKGHWGCGHSVLHARIEAELRSLERYQLFDWSAVQNLLSQASRGAFVNRDALRHLINVPVIDDFLFGSGFSGDQALRFLEPVRDIQFIRPTAYHGLDQKSRTDDEQECFS
jgi:NH3-dependent NAD+ synthetase